MKEGKQNSFYALFQKCFESVSKFKTLCFAVGNTLFESAKHSVSKFETLGNQEHGGACEH